MNGLFAAVLGLIVLTLVLHLVAWLVRRPLAARLLGDLPWVPAQCGLPIDGGQEVEFPSGEVVLRGTYLRTTAAVRRGAVVFCHEFNADRWSAGAVAAELRRRGLDVFTFDFRNHGSSGRVAAHHAVPWLTDGDLCDVRAAIDYLSTRPDADPRGLGLVGLGRGATAALCAAAGDPRVRAVVADSPLPLERVQAERLRRIARRWLGPLHVLLPRLVLETLAAGARVAWALRGSHAVSVDRAAGRVQCPVLLVCGAQDAHVPPSTVADLRAEIAGPTSFWLVREAAHARAVCARGPVYAQRIARFLLRRLAGRLALEPAHAARRPAVAVLARVAPGPASTNGHASAYPRRPR